jgi:hypothetical protein
MTFCEAPYKEIDSFCVLPKGHSGMHKCGLGCCCWETLVIEVDLPARPSIFGSPLLTKATNKWQKQRLTR